MKGKVAIVTGASSGIGEALSRELVARGWLVAMADIEENKRLSTELGAKAHFYHTNVADYDSQAKTFSEVFHHHGRLDALCANAGIVDRSSIYILSHRNSDTIPPAPDLSCTDVDYKGVIYGTQLAIHFMRKNNPAGGAIVATASIAGIFAHPTWPEYDGAKAGVVNFVRGIADVVRVKENIRVNCVCPGIVATNIIPPEMVAAVSPECLTPVDTVVKAYVKLLDDNTIYGKAVECAANEYYVLEEQLMRAGPITKRAVTVWDPVFKALHGENSEHRDAIL